MQELGTSSPIVRFGVFELDLTTGELRKGGVLIHLPPQPFKILALLASRPGQLITREEIQQQVWGSETFVDFDHGLNFAIKKIREALGDDAEAPRYVETLPRRGYRFIASVEALTPGPSPKGRGEPESVLVSQPSPAGERVSRLVGTGEGAAVPVSPPANAVRRHSPRHLVLAGAGLVLVIAVLLALNVGGLRERFTAAVGAGSALPYPKIESIAVLPLENLSGDKEQEYFADGMTDELIAELGQISSLRVISRTSMMRYKGTRKPMAEIARELNVEAVVEGSVLRAENSVRVTVNLIDAKTDRHLWAHSYEAELRDVLKLQDEVARAIASEIQIKVTPNEQVRLASARTVNPDAHEAYVKGRKSLETLTAEGVTTAIKYFERAIEIDPTYAAAYAGLADAYSTQGDHHYLLPREGYSRAKEAAAKALSLDSNLAEVYASLCNIRVRFDWDWQAAERDCMRALQLNSNAATALRYASRYRTAIGQTEEGVNLDRRYVELDPLTPFAHYSLGWAYHYARRYDEAIVAFERALALDPHYRDALAGLGHTYLEKKMFPEAFRVYSKVLDPNPAWFGNAYARAGERKKALKVLKEEQERSKREYVAPGTFAWIYTGLGDRDQAFYWLEKEFEERDTTGFPWFKVAPAWDPLRSDPRFQALLRRMNFPP